MKAKNTDRATREFIVKVSVEVVDRLLISNGTCRTLQSANKSFNLLTYFLIMNNKAQGITYTL